MFKKFIILTVTLGFIFIPALVFAETMWTIIPSQPKKSGMVKWAWTWGKYMNKNNDMFLYIPNFAKCQHVVSNLKIRCSFWHASLMYSFI